LKFLEEAANNPKVLGIKDTSGEPEYFEKVLEIFHSKGKKVMQGDTKAGQNESIRKVDGMVSVEANLYSEDLVALLDKNNKFNSEKLKKIMADIANRKAEINGDSTAAIKSILVDAKIFESDLA